MMQVVGSGDWSTGKGNFRDHIQTDNTVIMMI